MTGELRTKLFAYAVDRLGDLLPLPLHTEQFGVDVVAEDLQLREEMIRAYDLDPPLAVDIGVGDDWNEAKS